MKNFLIWTFLVFFGLGIIVSYKDGLEAKAEQEARIKLDAEKKAKVESENKIDFTKNKKHILESIDSLIENNKFVKAEFTINKYEFLNDDDLMKLKAKMIASKKEYDKKVYADKLITKLKQIPAKEFVKNYKLYTRLLEIYPDNKKYKEKVAYYKIRAEKQKAKEAAERLFYGEAPTQSSWDGSYHVVDRYLKTIMHDPSSLDIEQCTNSVKVIDLGWVVGCKYRGNNAFGAKVVNVKWFAIRNNQVVKMMSEKPYR